MGIRVGDVNNAVLDRWVAKAEGIEVRYSSTGEFWRILGEMDEIQWLPHRDWAQGGPIVERERIAIVPCQNGWEASLPSFGAENPAALQNNCRQTGPTPLVAAMRCYICHKFGEQLEE